MKVPASKLHHPFSLIFQRSKLKGCVTTTFQKVRPGLTVSSTRTQPARSAFMSLVLDFSSSFIFRPPVGPVNCFR